MIEKYKPLKIWKLNFIESKLNTKTFVKKFKTKLKEKEKLKLPKAESVVIITQKESQKLTKDGDKLKKKSIKLKKISKSWNKKLI